VELKKQHGNHSKISLPIFLGNRKAENYRDVMADLVQSHKAMGCNMSLKAHFLDSHLDFFPEIWR
jgi:hypothetical protein